MSFIKHYHYQYNVIIIIVIIVIISFYLYTSINLHTRTHTHAHKVHTHKIHTHTHTRARARAHTHTRAHTNANSLVIFSNVVVIFVCLHFVHHYPIIRHRAHPSENEKEKVCLVVFLPCRYWVASLQNSQLRYQ